METVTHQNEKRLNPPDHLIYAGASERRLLFLRHAFPYINISSVFGGDEENVDDTVRIMRKKIHTVRSTLSFNGNSAAAIAAADTRTTAFCFADNGPRSKGLGKPLSAEEVRLIFLQMMALYKYDGTLPTYFATSSSGLHYNNEDWNIIPYHSLTTGVILDPSAIQYLSSERGFALYVAMFHRFYSSCPYSNNGLRPITLTDISGGLSLPVLSKLGAVVTIDDTNPNQHNYRDVYTKGLYNVAVGFSPKIFPFEMDMPAKIQSWPWLNEVVETSL